MSFDIYTAVTDRIIQQLEKGVIPWEKPWTGVQGRAYSGVTGKPYSLLNQMLLRSPGAYFTYNEVTKRGGHVRKGEKSSMIVFWKQLTLTSDKDKDTHIEEDTDGQEEKKAFVLRYYNVFHIDQCDDLTVEAPQTATDRPTSPAADNVITDYTSRENLTLRHQKGDEAYYSPSRNCVVLPLMEQFTDLAEYYSTAFHELTHSTGHATRLNRLTSTAHFGNTEYSKEELTAEIGAAALMNYTGTETAKAFRNSAAYIQNWLTALRNDRRMIVYASGAAAKAVDYILAGA